MEQLSATAVYFSVEVAIDLEESVVVISAVETRCVAVLRDAFRIARSTIQVEHVSRRHLEPDL